MSVSSGTKRKEGGIGETARVVFHALIIALVIRTFLFQPFNIPSGSMKATLDDYRVKETFAGSRPLSKLLTSEQRRFFADHAPEGVALDDLARLGPINVLKLKFRHIL